jgi:hypothetical protein
MSTSTVVAYLNGTATVPQILLAVVIVSLIYTTLISAEFLYKSLTAVAKTRTALLPYTYTSDKPQEIRQDPNDPSSLPIVPSDNEHSGIEFSYSCLLNINDSTFQQNSNGLLHIFHKGYNLPYPLMGPGVFLKGTTNTLRIYMNSTKTWNSYVEVENIPMKKWFHLAIVGRGNSVEVYLNGNLSKKLNFEGGLPYQNFGNFFVFSQRMVQMSHSLVPSTDADGFTLLGPVTSSMISRLEYFSYALSFSEINALLNEGPSTFIVSATQNKPPYLADTYWTTSYTE